MRLSIALVCAVLLLAACSEAEPVVVEKSPAQIIERQIPTPTKGDPERIKNFGKTKWTFHCLTKFDYVQDGRNTATHATLRITRAHMRLTLPVEIITYTHPDKSVLEHENGHVRICKSLYESAEKIGQTACAAVIGKTYEADAESYQSAVQNALNKASDEVCNVYTAQTADIVQRVSDRYDSYYNAGDTVGDALEKAYADAM
jgi:hypothetical protein